MAEVSIFFEDIEPPHKCRIMRGKSSVYFYQDKVY